MTWFVPTLVADTVGHLGAATLGHLMHVRDAAVVISTMRVGISAN